MRKILTRYVWLALVIMVIIIICRQIKWLPSFSDLFKNKPLQIENTPIVIKEINALAQLITMTAYNEVVIDQTNPGNAVFNKFSGIKSFNYFNA